MTRITKRPKAKKLIKSIFERDGFQCYYCMCEFASNLLPTFEHLHPLSCGGTHDLDNLVFACQPCNLAVGNLPRIKKEKIKIAIRKKPTSLKHTHSVKSLANAFILKQKRKRCDRKKPISSKDSTTSDSL